MKFQFKQQEFQTAAVNAICNLFAGQRRQSKGEWLLRRDDEVVIGGNAPLELSDEQILQNLRGVQAENHLPLSATLDGKNFSVEMETGVGKTYTYIKTMYELNRRYGWSKFIVVVPSVAIREGVKKTFEVTAEHFREQYNATIRRFVYNSKNLQTIRAFVSDTEIWAMIVNVQAFSSTSADNRRILSEELDEFASQNPIRAIAAANPIVIIDEPQSVEGNVTQRRLKDFNALMTLRYSATHKNLYNLVYRLDALEAYQRRLVKKIRVTGFELVGGQSAGYIFFERVNQSGNTLTATLTFRRRSNDGAINRITRKVKVGDNLRELSNDLAYYERGFIVTELDGADDSLTFANGTKIFVGQAVGDVNEDELRRIQIRETINTHLAHEAKLFNRGVKVLSLFFIDEVAKYRAQDGSGIYAKIFEEEYSAAVKNFHAEGDYRAYLESIAARDTHAGYFSVDKKNRAANSDDVDAYDLIMRDKERLLDFRTPVRFIFSHSALREGWDNPNVFQICTLKQSSSDIRRRQEVGRGMRLCVNQYGERVPDYDLNVLTVIASESYKNFAAGLQREIAEAVNRPKIIDANFFVGKKLAGRTVDENFSRKIYNAFIRRDYLDDDGHLTENFLSDKANDALNFGAELQPHVGELLRHLSVIVSNSYVFENGRANTVTVKLDATKLADENFLELWSRINRKAFYRIEIDSDKLINAAADALNEKLIVPESYFVVASGSLSTAATVDDLREGSAFVDDINGSRTENFHGTSTRLDVIGELVKATDLTRRDVAEILHKLKPEKFSLIERDAEKFIAEATTLINSVKSVQSAAGITYTALDETFDTKIFPPTIYTHAKTVPTTKSLYDHAICDSNVEKKFAEDLEAADAVAVYVKLPKSFYIPTPLGNYTPDWAIVFGGNYFVVETKGTDDENKLSAVECGKIACARKFFCTIGGGKVKYIQLSTYRRLEDFLNGGLK